MESVLVPNASFEENVDGWLPVAGEPDRSKVPVTAISAKKTLAATYHVDEYSDRPRIAEVQYLPTKSWQVVDLATGKKVAAVTPKTPTFHVELRDDRARLFHLRPLR